MSQSFGIMFGDGRSLGALIVSALLHVAIAVGVAASSKASAARVRDDVVRPDAWSGNTFEVDALLAQAALPQAAAPKAAEPVPAVPATPAPPEVKEPVRARSVRPAPPRAAATAPEPPSPESPAPGERSSENEASSERAAAAPRESRRPRSQEDAGGAAAEAPQTYGAAGQAAMERNLAKAFTRAIPAAISKDPIWSELELGHAGSAKLEITIDEEGKIASAEPERPPTRQLKRLLDRTLILLRSGRFALSRGEGAGTETLELEATISERPAKADESANPRDPVQLGFEPPSSEKAGRAFFTLASGRHVEILVKLVPPGG